MWKLYTGDMPCWQKSRYQNKNWLLAQNIQILGSKLHIFVPSCQLEPHRSMLSARKRCLTDSLIWGYQMSYLLPENKFIFGSKMAKFGISPNIDLFSPFGPMPDQKTMPTRCLCGFPLCGNQNFCFLLLKLETMQTRCLGGFLICGYQNICSLPKWLGCFAQNRPFLPQYVLFGHI